MNLFLSSDADEYIILLINSVSMSKFEKFIKAIDQKEDWIEELCSCYFETENNNKEYYPKVPNVFLSMFLHKYQIRID